MALSILAFLQTRIRFPLTMDLTDRFSLRSWADLTVGCSSLPRLQRVLQVKRSVLLSILLSRVERVAGGHNQAEGQRNKERAGHGAKGLGCCAS